MCCRFLISYSDDLTLRREKDPRFAKKKKTKMSRADREEAEAAIAALVERMHPEASPLPILPAAQSSSLPTAGFDWSVLTYAPGRPQPPKEQKKKKMSEQERAQLKQERKKNKELVRNFLENYEEDMHKRRLHIKQARRLAAEEDAARMARPTKH